MNISKNTRQVTNNISKNENLISVIIPVTDISKEQHKIQDSFDKIKTKDTSSLEFIFINSRSTQTEEWDKYISSVKRTNKYPVKSVKSESNEFYNNAIQAADGKILAFLNPSKLKSVIYLTDFIRFTREDLFNNKLILPVFEEEKPKTKINLSEPLFFLPKKKAYQLSKLASTLHIDFIEAISDFSSKLELKTDTFNLKKSNPFQFIKSPSDFTKSYKWLIVFYQWYILIPLLELGNQKLKEINPKNETSIFRLIFVGIALFLFFLMPYLGYQSGTSADEYVNYKHAKYVMEYFKTSGADSSALNTPVTNLKYYGQSFDNITAIVNEVFSVEKVYEVRHILNSFSGWLAILFSGLLASLIAGWRAGVLTLLFMFLSPRFIGHSWNNPKDIPFAMAYIYTIYYLVLFLKQLPRIKMSTVIFMTLGVALAISVRIGGLLLIAYLFMFVGLYYLFTTKITNVLEKTNLIQLGKTLLLIGITSVVGYFIGLLLWPYALQNPIENPLNSLEKMTNYSIGLKQIFEGNIIWSDKAPWYYSIKYMLISIPIAILAGFIINLFTAVKNRRKINLFFVFVLFFSFAFPIIYIIYKESNVYGGWRHLIFSYPTLVIMSAIGYETVLKTFKNKYSQITFLILLLLIFYHPIRHIIVNHPYQYIYYNELKGTDKAFGEYEMDYYHHSMKKGSEWLIDNIVKKHNGEKLIIGTNGNSDYFFRNHKDITQTKYIRYYERGNHDWDYAIICNSYLNPFQLQKGLWPPKNTIHTIKVDNQPICAIVKREDKNDHFGYKKMRNRQSADAIDHLEKAIKYDKNNECALLNLAWTYNSVGAYDNALKNISQCLKVYPDWEKALDMAGRIYIKKNEIDNAISVFKKALQVNNKFSSAYYYLGYIQFYKMRNNKLALKYAQSAIKADKRNKQAHLLIEKIQKNSKKTRKTGHPSYRKKF